ncbi:hypothetical protein BLNAU_15040 [Blattamonas nauphoetae]|uniref:Uncharacterized protein n=1 Tax=Blattamonas nauphoetae TaxID=2049346 RepID=A0ABQ9XIJ8_9EUKA|nr:hypothetical protein BLNAU_15040 [Blattamonas nauphoetae]
MQSQSKHSFEKRYPLTATKFIAKSGKFTLTTNFIALIVFATAALLWTFIFRGVYLAVFDKETHQYAKKKSPEPLVSFFTENTKIDASNCETATRLWWANNVVSDNEKNKVVSSMNKILDRVVDKSIESD